MGGMLKGMGAKASTMTMIDVHAHFLSDFYTDALLMAGLRQADGITQLPARDVGAACRRWTGFRCVSDALVAYEQYHKVRVAQEVTVKDLRDSIATSLKRFRGGIATYLEVLDNQRSLFSAQLTLAQGPRQRVSEPRATL